MIRYKLREFYRNKYRFRKFKVLSRCACLGNRIIKDLGWEKNSVNHQKSRVDYILEYKKSKVPSLSDVKKLLRNSYIIGTIEQQRYDFFSYKKPDLIFIDSYSELTDQIFINDQEKVFLANYSDVKEEKMGYLNYKCEGLLNKDFLYKNYYSFFKKVESVYPGVTVVFIHFPSALESREKYVERAQCIFEVIEDLKNTFPFLISLSLPSEKVLSASKGSEEFKKLPYHYDESVYEEFIALLRNSGVIDYNE